MPQNNNSNNFNSKNMQQLIGILAAKAGVPRDKLEADLKAGKLDSAMENMSPSQKQKFNQIVSNPALANMFISNPQAQELYKKFVG
jgi:hypothetical protein